MPTLCPTHKTLLDMITLFIFNEILDYEAPPYAGGIHTGK
jgi:hypothetical protein